MMLYGNLGSAFLLAIADQWFMSRGISLLISKLRE